MKKNILTSRVLKNGVNEGKSIYFANMSDIDDYSPVEDDGKFFFEIEIDGEYVKFYQSGEYPNAFSDEYTTQALVFTPEIREDLELHIINNYE